MPLNKLLTLSTKRSGFIVSLPLGKFETREQKKQRHLPSKSRKNFTRNSIDRGEQKCGTVYLVMTGSQKYERIQSCIKLATVGVMLNMDFAYEY